MEKFVPADFNDYTRHFPAPAQTALREMRSAIKKAAPRAQETISYNLPAFSLDGKMLVWFAAFKSHIGFYPGAAAVTHFKDDFAKYKTAKGSVQFPLDRSLPVGLIGRVVKFKTKQI
jgi:uncharacterized protein YdhG (YjbR/CyaY superfamily)